MNESVQSRLQVSQLVPLVSSALGKPITGIANWECQQMRAGGSAGITGGLGLFRVSGIAVDAQGSSPFSLILKTFSPDGEISSKVPSEWNYWKREVYAYQSGLLAQLPGALRTPRCYGVEEYPGDDCWVWMEAIQEAVSDWTMEHYHLAARHLGEFNGAYLAGHPLPQAQAWFSQGRVREWNNIIHLFVEDCRQNVQTPLGQRWFRGDSFERTIRLWKDSERLLTAFERLPLCFCHHDAFRRNLMLCKNAAGVLETTAIDWALPGMGRVGEEIGLTTANSLFWLDVPADQAKELDQAVFSGYIEGLRAAGWQGDMRQARLGYAVNAFIVAGAFWSIFHVSQLKPAPDGSYNLEKMFQRPVEHVLDACGTSQLFMLDLADEAFKLVDDLGW